MIKKKLALTDSSFETSYDLAVSSGTFLPLSPTLFILVKRWQSRLDFLMQSAKDWSDAYLSKVFRERRAREGNESTPTKSPQSPLRRSPV